ncbi:MAG TPA: lanthionine synthetase LanC family protein [Thermoanaerobaculia bacterium]
MTRKLIVLFVLFAAIVVPAEAKRRPVQPRETRDSTYLDVSLRVSNWLAAMAQPAGERLAWPYDAATPRFTAPGLPGTAGVGTFYLRLYQVTRDPRHLANANAAANEVAATLLPATHFDWQAGSVGCGSFLLALYRETRDPEQLRRAQRVADSLLAQAIPDGNGGLYWLDSRTPNTIYTGMAHGAAGVAMLLLQLHEQSPDARYLGAAESALQWIARHTVPLGANGIGWKRLTTDNHAYHGWCGGSAGILFVLAKAYELIGNDAYRTLLVKTADGLVAAGRPERVGLSWPQTSNGNGSFLVYCHGSGSVIGALTVAYEVTGDSRYLATARAAVDFLDDVGERHGEGRTWPQVERGDLRQYGLMIGTASIGHAVLRLYRHDRDPRLLDLARAAAAFLIAEADAPGDSQTSWPTLAEPVPARYANDQSTRTGWWDGTSGIAMFLLELHDYTNGRQPPADFSPANP